MVDGSMKLLFYPVTLGHRHAVDPLRPGGRAVVIGLSGFFFEQPGLLKHYKYVKFLIEILKYLDTIFRPWHFAIGPCF